MIRQFAVLPALLVSIVFAGCEPPAVNSVAANAPPGPPPPATPPPVPVATSEPPNTAEPTEFAVGGRAENFADETVSENATSGDDAPSSVAANPDAEPAAPSPAITQTPTAPADSGPFISLSAGVAVPQLLPEGTQVGVSVDYSLRGAPKTSCRYFLVVESSAGEVAVPVKLEPQGGTFQGFLPPKVRPEHQPFRARIDEVPPQGERMRVSNSAPLATSY